MRLLTATDIIDFHQGRDDLLVITETGEYTTLDYSDLTGRTDAYGVTTTHDDIEVTVLLERDTIDAGEWFADALDDDGDLTPDTAAEMADIINNDAGLRTRTVATEAEQAHAAYLQAETAYKAATIARQVAFARAIDAMGRGGNAILSSTIGLSAPTVKSIADRGRQTLADQPPAD